MKMTPEERASKKFPDSFSPGFPTSRALCEEAIREAEADLLRPMGCGHVAANLTWEKDCPEHGCLHENLCACVMNCIFSSHCSVCAAIEQLKAQLKDALALVAQVINTQAPTYIFPAERHHPRHEKG